MERKMENIFSLVLVVVFALAIYLAFGLPVAARSMPLLFGTCGLIAALIQLTAGFKKNVSASCSGKERKETRSFKEIISNKEINFFAWLFLFYFLIYLLGFTLAIPLFLFLILLIKYREKLLLVFLMSLGFCSAYYILFIRIMKIAVYEGLLFNILRVPYF